MFYNSETTQVKLIVLLSPSPPQARVFQQLMNHDKNGTGMQLAETNRQITS